MKRNFTFFILLIATTFIFSSCIKGYPVSDPVEIEGTWQITGIESNSSYDWDGDGYNERDILGNYTPCQRDIILVFEQGGYGESREGCNAPWETMYWQSMNDNMLRIELRGDNLDLQLRQFSNNIIRGEDYVYIDGRNFTITYTLERVWGRQSISSEQ